jgi:hypothetical protein
MGSRACDFKSNNVARLIRTARLAGIADPEIVVGIDGTLTLRSSKTTPKETPDVAKTTPGLVEWK